MRDQIQRKNTVIDPVKGIDIATAISKFTSGGVMLTDAIGELAKSLTILLQDQMGYSSFKKRHNSCKFDLFRECFYYVGHDAYTGIPVSHIIHEWPSAGDDYTFGDGETGHTASRTEIGQFAKDLPGFLEKLRDDLMSSAAESEEKAEMIASLADLLRECNLIILKRQQDQRDRGPSFEGSRDGWDAMIEPFVETVMNGIHAVDDIPQTSIEDRHTKYANLLWPEMTHAFRRGLSYGIETERMLEGPKDSITLSPSPCSSFTSSILVEAKRIDMGDGVGKCPVCGAYMDLVRLTVAGTVVAYVCPNGHSYLYSHKPSDVDQPGDERTAAGYIQPLPGSSVEGPISVIAERVLLGLKSGEKRLCGECENPLDLVRIVVCDNTVAIIGVCDEGHTYLYPPSDFEEI